MELAPWTDHDAGAARHAGAKTLAAAQRATTGRRWLALTSVEAPSAGLGSVGDALPHGELSTASCSFGRATRGVEQPSAALQQLLPAEALDGGARGMRGTRSFAKSEARPTVPTPEWVSRPNAPVLHPKPDALKPSVLAYTIPPEVESRHRSFDPVPFFAPPAGAYDPKDELTRPRQPVPKFGPPPPREPDAPPPGRPLPWDAAVASRLAQAEWAVAGGEEEEGGGSGGCGSSSAAPDGGPAATSSFASGTDRWKGAAPDTKALLEVRDAALRPELRAFRFGTSARPCVVEAGLTQEGFGDYWAEGEGWGEEGCEEEEWWEEGSYYSDGAEEQGAYVTDRRFAGVERRAPSSAWSRSTTARGLLPEEDKPTSVASSYSSSRPTRPGDATSGAEQSEGVEDSGAESLGAVAPTAARIAEQLRQQALKRPPAADQARAPFGSSAPRIAWLPADASPRSSLQVRGRPIPCHMGSPE